MATDPMDFEHDVTILDRYLAYSTELIRLALLAIGVVGYLLTTEPFSNTLGALEMRGVLWFGVGALVMSCAAGLLHRYIAPDALSDHLEHLRGRRDKPYVEFRNYKFKISSALLVVSAVSLCFGVVVIVYMFARAT